MNWKRGSGSSFLLVTWGTLYTSHSDSINWSNSVTLRSDYEPTMLLDTSKLRVYSREDYQLFSRFEEKIGYYCVFDIRHLSTAVRNLLFSDPY